MKTATDFRKVTFKVFEQEQAELIESTEKMIESAANRGFSYVLIDTTQLRSAVAMKLKKYLEFHGFSVAKGYLPNSTADSAIEIVW